VHDPVAVNIFIYICAAETGKQAEQRPDKTRQQT